MMKDIGRLDILDLLSTEMRRGNLSNVLRAGAKSGSKTKHKTTKHKDFHIGRETLNDGRNDGEETADEVNRASTDLISKTEKWSTAKVANGHEGIDNTQSRSAVLKTKVRMPVVIGVDTADDTPIDTVPACFDCQYIY